MAGHQQLAAQLGIDVAFRDPRSPWQRGSNENAGRLPRQFLTRGADLRRFSTRDLDNIGNRSNTKSRRVLDRATLANLFWHRLRIQIRRVSGSAHGQCG